MSPEGAKRKGSLNKAISVSIANRPATKATLRQQSTKNTAAPLIPNLAKAKTPNSKILKEAQAFLSERDVAHAPVTSRLKPPFLNSMPPTSAITKLQLSSKPLLPSESATPLSSEANKTLSASASRLKPSQRMSGIPNAPSTADTQTPPNKSIPIAALNSAIVSQISSRAGARPANKGLSELSANYKRTARRVTGVIVAIPILLVTSYVLYQRLVLGEEKKELPSNYERRDAIPKTA